MQYYFSDEKNALLKEERGIGFDDIVFAIQNGGSMDVLDHPSEKYPHQQIYVVQIDDYVYSVPYVSHADGVFLKTIYASRKLTKRYLGGNKHEKDNPKKQ